MRTTAELWLPTNLIRLASRTPAWLLKTLRALPGALSRPTWLLLNAQA